MRQRWSKWRPRGHYLQFMAMSTEKTNGENWGSDPWHSWGALSGKPSCVNMHDLRVSATVILYVLCMHVHAHIMKHWNVCKQRHMQTRTCKQTSQGFFPLLVATYVTTCDVMWLPCLMISGSSVNACKSQVCRARSTLEFLNVRWVSPSGSKRLVLPCWKPWWPESNSCSSQFLLVVFLWLAFVEYISGHLEHFFFIAITWY